MSAIKISDVSLSYKEKAIFRNVDFFANHGEVIGLLGSNGSGKTTFFDLLCGIAKPNAGSLTQTARRQLYLSQTLSLPAALSMQDIYILITNLGADKPPTKSETFERLKKWSPALYKRYSNILIKKTAICSYGELRCFATLTLLTMNADLLILDEPTAGIDPELRHLTWLAIRSAAKEGSTVLVSSHYIQEITSNCHRFYMLAHQQLEPFESADKFLARHHAKTLDEAFIKATM